MSSYHLFLLLEMHWFCYDKMSQVARWERIHQPMQETQIRSLGWEDGFEKETVTHFSILAWEIPWTVEPHRLQSMESHRVRHDLMTEQQQLIIDNKLHS